MWWEHVVVTRGSGEEGGTWWERVVLTWQEHVVGGVGGWRTCGGSV